MIFNQNYIQETLGNIFYLKLIYMKQIGEINWSPIPARILAPAEILGLVITKLMGLMLTCDTVYPLFDFSCKFKSIISSDSYIKDCLFHMSNKWTLILEDFFRNIFQIKFKVKNKK